MKNKKFFEIKLFAFMSTDFKHNVDKYLCMNTYRRVFRGYKHHADSETFSLYLFTLWQRQISLDYFDTGAQLNVSMIIDVQISNRMLCFVF